MQKGGSESGSFYDLHFIIDPWGLKGHVLNLFYELDFSLCMRPGESDLWW